MVSEGRKIEDETRGGKCRKEHSESFWLEDAPHRQKDTRARGPQALNLPAAPTASA